MEIDYIQYLKTYHKFNDIPRHCKYAVPEYEKYLDNLLNYLYDFFQRQNALSDSRKIYENFEQNFEIAWENGSIEWWKQPSYDHERYLKPLDKIFNSQGIYKSVQEVIISVIFRAKNIKNWQQNWLQSRPMRLKN